MYTMYSVFSKRWTQWKSGVRHMRVLAVEKYLKWFLILNDIEPPKIHDLEELEKLCEAIQPKFSDIYEKCSILSGYAVQSRYPNEMKVENMIWIKLWSL